jgi:NAD(P)-dependent dehydrogenase (short-subunit alcohol dehydrogenase family)
VALAIETDVINRDQARAAVERTVREPGRLDIVINNAGVMLLVRSSTPPWRSGIGCSSLPPGLLYIAHAALPHLLRAAEREPRQVADLVNVSSVAGDALTEPARPRATRATTERLCAPPSLLLAIRSNSQPAKSWMSHWK